MPEPAVHLTLPPSWITRLARDLRRESFQQLERFLFAERKTHLVFPRERQVFRALELTPYPRVRVVILGQDPYHGDGLADGLAFSVARGVKPPPSLRNIYRELSQDLGVAPPSDGCLEPWAQQGVLLLNTVLTVRAHEAGSHRNKGWESFTDAVLRAVNDHSMPVAFLLWGAQAREKKRLIDTSRHLVLEAVHPSPLSAHRGFFGQHPFSRTNHFLVAHGRQPIHWVSSGRMKADSPT